MKEVNFDKINFNKYLETKNEYDNLRLSEYNDVVSIIQQNQKLDELRKEVEEYEFNFKLMFSILSKKGKGASFAHKLHCEVRDRNSGSYKIINEDESYIIDPFEEPNDTSENVLDWRYEVGDIAIINDMISENHDLREGDKVEILKYLPMPGCTAYEVKHESSNYDTVFIINDYQLT